MSSDPTAHAQMMENIGRMAGGIAHDFNNLLTSIRGLSSLALQEIEPEHPLRADLEQIEKAADRAADLTRQLLGLSRRQAIKLGNVDLNAVLAGFEPILRRILSERVELSISYEPGLPGVTADAAHLRQITLSLCLQAHDAMHGPGTLRIATGIERIGGEGALPAGEYGVMRVASDGPGIRAEEVDALFDPYFTTTAVTADAGRTTVHGSIEQAAGWFTLETGPSMGATFTIHLPRAGA